MHELLGIGDCCHNEPLDINTKPLSLLNNANTLKLRHLHQSLLAIIVAYSIFLTTYILL